MKKKKLLWHFYPYFLLITIISASVISVFAYSQFKSYFLSEKIKFLKSGAILAEPVISHEIISQSGGSDLEALCISLGEKIHARITVISETGEVLGDSDNDPAIMDNHSDRPEYLRALSGKEGVSSRLSFTLNKNYIYYAVPIKRDGEIIGVLRISVPETEIKEFLSKIRFRIILFTFFISMISVLLIYVISYYINIIFGKIEIGAEKFASGELDYRFHIVSSDEIGSLANSLNIMASQLSDRLKTITMQRNELMGVLTSMIEGVIAVDNDERIIRINSSAEKLLDLNAFSVKGQKVQEVVRNVSLYGFIKKVLLSDESLEEIISIKMEEDKYLQLHGTSLIDADVKKIGALIVINDITSLKRLERIRQDFVANVSHELKTPITSIKGFVETLRDGAFEDKDTLVRFLGIIDKHSDRLNSIVEDILMLSRIEQGELKKQLEFEQKNVREILNNVVMICSSKAVEKNIEIIMECAADIFIKCNSSLIEQALINLVDNSIKYSDPEKKVFIKVFKEDGNVVFEVEDNGWGIPKADISRIFERFYRVDKARSRQLGGTGLGLSIVKHIVQSHDGKITVNSEIGTGSTFKIILPAL